MPTMKVTLGWLLLVLCPVLAYYPAISGDLLLDDHQLYVEDPVMNRTDGLLRIWLHPLENNEVWPYLPVTRSLFWIERQLFGLDLEITHTINIALHILSALLLWKLLQAIRFHGAWWVGIVFALHPIYVQSVAWIAERKNGIAAIFFLLCVWAYIRFAQRRSWLWYGMTLVLLGAALLSKTSTIMLPVIFLFCHVWLRLPWKKSDIWGFLPFLGIVGGVAYGRLWFETHAFGAKPHFALDVWERVALAGHVPFFYIKKFVLPYPLIFNYPQWTIDLSRGSMILPLLSLLLVVGLLSWKYASWGRPLFLGLGGFFVMLFPVLGLFPNGWFQFSYVADHWVHLPSIPLLLLCVFLVVNGRKVSIQFLGQFRSTTPLWMGMGLAIGSVLGILTFLQTHIYQNHEALWTHTASHNPTSWVAHYNLGVIYQDQKDDERALSHFNATLTHREGEAKAHLNRGGLYARLGKPEQAIADYNEVLKREPKNLLAYKKRGMAYIALENPTSALVDFNVVLHLDPSDTETYLTRGLLYSQMQEYEAGIKDFDSALQFDPTLTQAYYYRALNHTKLANFESALKNYNEVIHLEPNLASAYKNRGLLYMQQFGKSELACQDWQRACQLGDCQNYRLAQETKDCL